MPYSLSLSLAALAVTLLATPAVMRLARAIGAFDHPGPRRIHREPVPTLGGLAFAAAVLGVAWAARALPGPARELDPRPLVGLSLASIPILALGVVDDLRGVPPWAKLVIQACAGLVLSMFGFGVPLITNPFGGAIASGPFNVALTVAWVVIVINAINLIDGLDGLASGAVLIASMALWWVSRTHGDFYVMFIGALLAGATLGFLRYNFPPARVFMGDVGSHFLGLTLAAASLLENRKETAAVTLLFPLVAMGLPIADSLLAFVRRAAHGKPVFRADSEHIHHRLLRLGMSPRGALFVLWYLCAYMGVMAVALAAMPRAYGWMMLGLLAMGLVLAFEVLEFIDRALAEREGRRRE
ncbi:MAG: undecaprenyl/decaprenyl-phosphate alpha-N-acetylglucosaminyl 1-phosphate transferase [Candidatus Eisenbacteria bacterium]|uniref:Undecaprenyl/decaprenyl-phosphate alpha-N-acetylglucosaminyl 1-phosphate transferase n=1 Tax=Eiseniibacteriota bacterium TaxID=2212470 RepID=A0A9D6QKA8_UNCEI|nr:undecaprenyl/decaprenyl-phosphate alpha-N-acetylglucosaminyl 1-phosphate transferase [Candidatus Eisenbacteria bacterium]MBI3540006.1 undecaprenyl/decaprenyl-phosphate alpha-N-acetylglucosaminyl 1-phosphate transferase [Candidatus Eisenbacteria bacterium]